MQWLSNGLTQLENEMFVTSKKYNDLELRYHRLGREWDLLVARINEMGGQKFLDGKAQLDQSEIKKLITLCHPDKHNGKAVATEMTQRLLELRT